jgi:hypothetical protein
VIEESERIVLSERDSLLVLNCSKQNLRCTGCFGGNGDSG